MGNPPIRLSEVMQSRDFARSYSEGSRMTYDGKREGGFMVYTDEKFSTITVNRPSLFSKGKAYEQDSYFTSGFGFRGDLYCPSLIHVHYHPSGSKAMPSFGDLKKLRGVRKQNRNLGELCHSDYFVNPLAVVGFPIDGSNSKLFLFQEKVKAYGTEDDLVEKLAKSYSEVRGERYDAQDMEWYGCCRWLFCSTKKMSEFLENSGMHIAEIVRFEDGKIRSRDLNKLEKFDYLLFEEVPKEESDDRLLSSI